MFTEGSIKMRKGLLLCIASRDERFVVQQSCFTIMTSAKYEAKYIMHASIDIRKAQQHSKFDYLH